ncbi:MAG: phosphoserine transaminase [Rhodospirillaceae bacterium]|nr:phosphoserine transaminase [Rhodospirillaceae bacterium]
MTAKPTVRPARPNFASGPCAKHPGWSIEALSKALVGRFHRSKPAHARIKAVIDNTRKVLNVPSTHRIAIVPASDTGAVEMMLWQCLGARPVDMLTWESFGETWVNDVIKQLKLKDARIIRADYGKLADLAQVNPDHDVVFTWNGTTSGVRVPNADWIPAHRKGLTICDATSAAFAMDLPWDKLDITTYSWQKVLGGEAQHGMLILSQRAVDRLESYTPPWPLPKIFRLTKGGKLQEPIFDGDTINTVSMLCVEDALDGLAWAESVGGLKGLIARSEANLKVVSDWVARTPWIEFLASSPDIRSCTSICLYVTADWFKALPKEKQIEAAKKITALLDAENVAYDINSHRDAPAGIRIWGGATVEAADTEKLLPWLEWAYGEVLKTYTA